jgi:hypothetical protein
VVRPNASVVPIRKVRIILYLLVCLNQAATIFPKGRENQQERIIRPMKGK